ncbi:MAG TPA: NADH-quinone oxidoreductase subunit D [Candidatus Avalokitesvara rifleensis]|uniref:NADH-quinone oxidoreductase subunit D n=1 Tax=Candidatus Avalokitesvara rifleensis TaxID=3367620 RepID=UPI0027135923|nr:NADH-quinone oxidoreductase subunit D [Candidatus Brocadiales bacterium]
MEKTSTLAQEMHTKEMTLHMGPSHPAMHGTVRMFLELDGETVVRADVNVGYLHRGFEKMCENRTYHQAIIYTDRLNYVSPLINNFGYAMAVEKLFGVEVPDRCKFIRTIMSEICRVTDHLTCVAASAMELGALTAFLYMIKAREELWKLIEDAAGGRGVTPSYVRIGGVKDDLPDDFHGKTMNAIKITRDVLKEIHGLLTKNRIFVDRVKGVGAITPDEAISYGFTGPCLRSTGVPYDVRKAQPYMVYEQMNFDVPVGTNGDNYDRYLCRMEEMQQSMSIIEQALAKIPSGPIKVADKRITFPSKKEVYGNMEALINHFKLFMNGHGICPPEGEVYQAVEGANGELGFYVVSDGTGKPYRLRCRPPSFCNVSGVKRMIEGGMLADIVPTFGSVNMIGGECDR